jgi:uncharacterized delta-60 repeat protein
MADEGDLDTSFGDQGSVEVPLDETGNDHVGALVLGPDGEIFAAGWSGRAHVVALDSDGNLDASFGTDGVALIHPTWRLFPRSMTLDNGGRVIVAGHAQEAVTPDSIDSWLTRVDPAGSVDPSFADDGHVFVTGTFGSVRDVWLDAQGRIVAVGNRSQGLSTYILVARFLPNGEPDPSFGDNGFVAMPDVPTSAAVYGAPHPAGGIVVAATTPGSEPNDTDILVLRLTDDGQIDQGFGMRKIDIEPEERAIGIAVTPTGRIVVAGDAEFSTIVLTRLLPSGELDRSLRGTGKAIISDFGGSYPVAVATDEIGRIILAGEAPNTAYVARVRPNGLLDPGFGANGIAFLGPLGYFQALAVQPDGRILAGGVVGGSGSDSVIARFEATIPDITFVDDDDSVFENAIEKLAASEITLGCNPPDNNRFCPDDPVTRGQMAAFLVRALGYTDDGGGDLFVDDDDSVFQGAIDRLGTAGVTQGCNPPDNNRFCPDDPVTRGQMAAFLARAFGLP